MLADRGGGCLRAKQVPLAWLQPPCRNPNLLSCSVPLTAPLQEEPVALASQFKAAKQTAPLAPQTPDMLVRMGCMLQRQRQTGGPLDGCWGCSWALASWWVAIDSCRCVQVAVASQAAAMVAAADSAGAAPGGAGPATITTGAAGGAEGGMEMSAGAASPSGGEVDMGASPPAGGKGAAASGTQEEARRAEA